MSRVSCHLDELLLARGMDADGTVPPGGCEPRQPGVLKNDRAKAIRFTTLVAICDALDCQPATCSPWNGEGDDCEPLPDEGRNQALPRESADPA